MKQNIPIDNPVLPSDAFPSGKCWIWFGLSILLYLIINPIRALVAVLICAIAIFWNVLLRNKFGLYHLLFVSSFFMISFLWNLLFTHSVPVAAYSACFDLGYYFVVFFAAFVYRFAYAEAYSPGFSNRDLTKLSSFLIEEYTTNGRTTFALGEFAKSKEEICASRYMKRKGYIILDDDDIYQTVTVTETFINEFINKEPIKNHQESSCIKSDPIEYVIEDYSLSPSDFGACTVRVIEAEEEAVPQTQEDIINKHTEPETNADDDQSLPQESPAEPSDPPTEQSDEEVKVTDPLEIKSTENSSDVDNNCVDTKKLTIITILLLSLIAFIVVLLNLPISRTNKSGKPSEPNQYRVTVSFELISNNHVGNDWEKIIYCRDREIGKKTIITADKDFYIGCYVIELDDKNDDSAKADFIFERSPIGKIETKSSRITVTEDAGQYAGNTAVWEVTVTVERLS